jgi:sugar lactone lactonase YvrE
MKLRGTHSALPIAIAAVSAVLLTAAPASASPALVASAAAADADGVFPVGFTAHFDLSAGQTPENVAAEPDGSLNITFALARQVARVDPAGRTRILATLPAPADGGAGAPGNFVATTGIVRAADGTLFVLYSAGDADLTGLWRLRAGEEPRRVAALPPDSLPNGLALDRRTDRFYVADSALGRVWTIPASGGQPQIWSAAPELAPNGFAGANGLKVHDGAVWVSNLDAGTILRIPVGVSGQAGAPQVVAQGLGGVDDFAFTGRGNELLATLNAPNRVVRVRPGQEPETVLDAADGLQSPTSLAVRGRDVQILNAAFFTLTDPNILHVRLRGR